MALSFFPFELGRYKRITVKVINFRGMG